MNDKQEEPEIGLEELLDAANDLALGCQNGKRREVAATLVQQVKERPELTLALTVAISIAIATGKKKRIFEDERLKQCSMLLLDLFSHPGPQKIPPQTTIQ